jgi:hypothetical protein
MKNLMKRELVNDIVTGLLVAATFAAVVPADAFAQLSAQATTVNTNVLNPAMQVLTYISYGLGGVMTVAGIAGAKKHADNPSSNPLGPAIGKLGAGAAFLAAPFAIAMIQKTGNNTLGNGAVQSTTVTF